jgi:hypothetical protein
VGDVLRAAAVAGAGVGAAGRGGGLLGHGWAMVLGCTVGLCGDGEACD